MPTFSLCFRFINIVVSCSCLTTPRIGSSNISQRNSTAMTSLHSLASIISYQAAEISTILAANKVPLPSSAEDGTVEYTEAGLDVDLKLRKARNALISSAQDMIRLAMGPTDQILTLAWSVSLRCCCMEISSSRC